MNKNNLRIFDTTLRDGEQSPGYSMTTEEKVRFAVELEKLGVDVIEAGFPSASPDDFKAVQEIAKKIKKSEVCGLARATKSDIKTAWEAIKDAKKPRIHTFVATSKVHMEYKLKKTPEEVKEMTKKAVEYAKSLCDRVDFSPEDAGRSDWDFLVEVIDIAIEAGADVINIPDTVGYLAPKEYGNLIKYLKENCKKGNEIIWSTHCHNDLGLAVANSLAGVLNGATQVECTINGIGERAGNASLEEVVMNIKTRPKYYNIGLNIDTQQIINISNLLKKITGQPIQPNKAIVGRNAFAHESGIHQHGMLANSATYEIMKPEDIGLKKSEIVLGKHSGRTALTKKIEDLGYNINECKIDEIFTKFKKLADQKGLIEDADLDVLVLGNKSKQIYSLISSDVSCGTNQKPKAKIKIKLPNGEEKESISEGTGPVDASYKAIENIIGKKGELVEYRMDSVTSGLDAQAVVTLVIETKEGQKVLGRSGDTNIVTASINAFLNALGKIYKNDL